MTNLKFSPYFTFTGLNVRRSCCKSMLTVCKAIQDILAMETGGGDTILQERLPGRMCVKGHSRMSKDHLRAHTRGVSVKHKFDDLYQFRQGPEHYTSRSVARLISKPFLLSCGGGERLSCK